MTLTKKLKAYVIEKGWAKADDDDMAIKQAVAKALMTDGQLGAEKFAELSQTEEDTKAGAVKSTLDQVVSVLGEMRKELAAEKAAKTEPPKTDPVPAPAGDKAAGTPAPANPPANKAVQSALEKMILQIAPSAFDGEKAMSIRVKEAADGYSTTKSAAVYPRETNKGHAHPLAGKPVMDYSSGGRPIDNPSELDKAISGAFAKFVIQTARLKSKNTAFNTLPQHDKELLLYAMENEKWGGTTDCTKDYGGDENIKHRKLTPHEQKALIDDSTSGGLEAAPIVFDDQVIMTPLLNGELYPLVNTVPIDRGRRIEGVKVSNVTGSWGGVDDTAISLFNTASFVSAFDTTIFRWEGAIVIGLDFLSDTPVEFGSIITGQYGERLLEDLDDVIAVGNGTTQPEGITVKSGTTSISFGGAAATLGGYETLRFGVSKAEHKSAANSAVFCGSETSYMRAKAIPVGASDARRLSDTGNMPNYDDYRWMNRPYKINESLGNSKIFYAIMNKYRMYRRRGLSMRTTTEGSTLVRSNEMLMVAMARYGGQLERGAVAAVTTNAQA